MSREDDFRLRPGRIRSDAKARTQPFLRQALRAAQKAGGMHGTRSRRTNFGRGRAASLSKSRGLLSRARQVSVKTRVVRQARTPGGLAAHLKYLQRDGVTRDGRPGQLFNAEREGVSAGAFAERCEDDRHHFRFIVSPEDGTEIASLKDFTRDLMRQAERDLGTDLDWVAVEHWNTAHPHVHVLVRGRANDGRDLVISRAYISHGMRERAAALVTAELGERTDRELRRDLNAQVEADRFTKLDRALIRDASGPDGVVDLRPGPDEKADPVRQEKIGRLRKLERLGLANGDGRGRWIVAPDLERRLRDLGERGDVIARLHRTMSSDGREPDLGRFVVDGGREPVIGRLVARGLDDDLKGTAYAVVAGTDGRAHHLRLPDLDAAGDGAIGSVVELRRYDDSSGKPRIALAVRSDLSIADQVNARGATWLDRQLIANEPAPLAGTGFGAEVRAALEHRSNVLITEGLATRHGDRTTFTPGLIDALRRRELEAAAAKLSHDTGLTYRPTAEGDQVGGVYRQRLALASGRFAMIDDGLGFQLVPWSPSLERRLGTQVGGVALPGGGVDWSFGRKRGLGL